MIMKPQLAIIEVQSQYRGEWQCHSILCWSDRIDQFVSSSGVRNSEVSTTAARLTGDLETSLRENGRRKTGPVLAGPKSAKAV